MKLTFAFLANLDQLVTWVPADAKVPTIIVRAVVIAIGSPEGAIAAKAAQEPAFCTPNTGTQTVSINISGIAI
ncbi:hypothetical protein SDC9_115843 [bioreactor metagenome]|uniref:Uncharacterized protein n=1 Tax=bioreactor metagenome TaxID=1076179 RepID=A0A645BV01_9ZZZZ